MSTWHYHQPKQKFLFLKKKKKSKFNSSFFIEQFNMLVFICLKKSNPNKN